METTRKYGRKQVCTQGRAGLLISVMLSVAAGGCGGVATLAEAPEAPMMNSQAMAGVYPAAPEARMAMPVTEADEPNTEAYANIEENGFFAADRAPLSTFSIDVDTASYSNVRRFLNDGRLPPADAVRVEEMINYFDYDYAAPKGDVPFSVAAETGPCPWNDKHRLVHIGLQGREIQADRLPPRNLVFLLDVSGSMNSPSKLPLLKSALNMLTDQLRPSDKVAIVVYAGASGLVLPPTSGANADRIRDALSRLKSGGSTNGGAGIELAYRVARDSFQRGGINRVILATDGDFNVGTTNQGDLVRLIERERESGVFLTVLGFGTGNVKDSTMESLADKGNGNYAYIDSAAEARKVLVEEAGATLVTIAKDVKIQVEFNPTQVQAYRLIGYENRVLRAEDFNDDAKDAGEIGAGHTVTALYEIVPPGADTQAPKVDPLRYQKSAPPTAAAASSGELMTVKVRYKAPDGNASQLISMPVRDTGESLQGTSANFRFSAATAAFGMLLRSSDHRGATSWAMVRTLASGSRGGDPHGYRREFLQLVDVAARLSGGDEAPVTLAR